MLYSGDFQIKDKTTRFHQKKMLPKLKTWNYNIWLSQYSLLSFSVCNVKLKLSFSMKWKRLKFHQWTVAYLLNLCPVSHQSGQQLSWFTWPETQDLRYFFLQLYWHTKEFAVKEALFSITVLIINTFCLKQIVFVWRYLWCAWECVGKIHQSSV